MDWIFSIYLNGLDLKSKWIWIKKYDLIFLLKKGFEIGFEP